MNERIRSFRWCIYFPLLLAALYLLSSKNVRHIEVTKAELENYFRVNLESKLKIQRILLEEGENRRTEKGHNSHDAPPSLGSIHSSKPEQRQGKGNEKGNGKKKGTTKHAHIELPKNITKSESKHAEHPVFTNAPSILTKPVSKGKKSTKKKPKITTVPSSSVEILSTSLPQSTTIPTVITIETSSPSKAPIAAPKKKGKKTNPKTPSPTFAVTEELVTIAGAANEVTKSEEPIELVETVAPTKIKKKKGKSEDNKHEKKDQEPSSDEDEEVEVKEKNKKSKTKESTTKPTIISTEVKNVEEADDYYYYDYYENDNSTLLVDNSEEELDITDESRSSEVKDKAKEVVNEVKEIPFNETLNVETDSTSLDDYYYDTEAPEINEEETTIAPTEKTTEAVTQSPTTPPTTKPTLPITAAATSAITEKPTLLATEKPTSPITAKPTKAKTTPPTEANAYEKYEQPESPNLDDTYEVPIEENDDAYNDNFFTSPTGDDNVMSEEEDDSFSFEEPEKVKVPYDDVFGKDSGIIIEEDDLITKVKEDDFRGDVIPTPEVDDGIWEGGNGNEPKEEDDTLDDDFSSHVTYEDVDDYAVEFPKDQNENSYIEEEHYNPIENQEEPYIPPTDDEEGLSIPEMEEEEKQQIISSLVEEEKNETEVAVEETTGIIIPIMFLFMIFTAYQMSENPDGIYASICRLCISMMTCVINVLLLPLKFLCGNRFGSSHSLIIDTPDYREPYRGRHTMELT